MRVPYYLKRDIGLKIVALMLAIFLWVNVAERREVVLTVDLPLRYTNMPADMTFASEVPRDAKVEIRGRSKFLRWKLKDVYFAIDLSPAETGIVTHIISPSEIRLPPDKNVEVLEILEPKGIRVELDKLVTRKLPPRPRLKGDLPEGRVMIGKPRAEPAEIVISGAEKIISDLDSVPTFAVDRGDLGKDGRADTKVDLSGLLNVESDVEELAITARVESIKDLGIPSVPIVAPSRRGMRVQFTPDSLDVVISGAESRVDSLDPADLKLVVDVTGLPDGQLLFKPLVKDGRLFFEVRPVGETEEGQAFEIKANLESPHDFKMVSAMPEEISFVKR
jgi:YbbR domain-containing protein